MKIPASILPFSRPYRSVLGAGIGIATAYRGFFFLQFFFQLFPLITQLFLWTAVFAGAAPGSNVAGFGRQEMLTYFLLTNLLGLAGSGSLPWEMADDIRQGRLSQFILRPFHYFHYQWHLLIGRLCIEPIFLILPAALLLWLTRSVLHVPEEGWRLAYFAAAVALGIQVSFLINFILGTFSFWLLNNSGILHMMGPLQALFAGYWFPLALLPKPMLLVLGNSPFAYQTYFPLRIYLGQLDQAAALRGMGIQALWIAGMGFFAYWLWRRAIRAYSAVGG